MLKNISFVLVFALRLAAQSPEYTADHQFILPENYREWIYLTSGLGMTYGMVGGSSFDNVFVSPEAYKSFVQSGTWPDKTILIKEVRSSKKKGSLNKGGHYQEEMITVEAHVKEQGKSEFFVFGKSRTAKAIGPDSSCHSCHAQHGAVDGTFVQFYPTLAPIAKSKGTLILGR